MADEPIPGGDAPAPAEGVTIENAPPAQVSLLDTPIEDDPPADGADTLEGEGDPPAEGEDTLEGEGEGDQPIEYTDFEAPEGVTLNDEMLAQFKDFAKGKGLSQEEAQSVVDMGVNLMANADKQLAEQIATTRAEWREATLADEEFGGSKWREAQPAAKAGLERFGTPALKELLDQSGLGDHPEVIRYFYRVGKATGEHDFVNSGKPPSQGGSFYDHPTSKKI